MKDFIKKLFRSEDQSEDINAPAKGHIRMVLTHDKLTIGYLTYLDGTWEFVYSDEFKKQNQVDVLGNFPNKNMKYNAPDLWPFFAHRIPGLGQPKVQEIIKKEHLDPHNQLDLLKRFGRRSITNPFELEAV
jgi:HipA-like protein